MTVRLVGANPGLSLFASPDDEQPVAYASVWRVDWSSEGAGNAIVLWHEGRVRLIGQSSRLATWLAGDFTRHFPEVAGLEWPVPELIAAPVVFESDLTHGIHAEGADVVVEITEPMAIRSVRIVDFELGDVTNSLSTVIWPCRHGSISLAGGRLSGAPRVNQDPISSSAFLADAEVWSSSDD